MTVGNSHFGMMVQIARWGFPVVPSMITHKDWGACTLYMDGNGVRVVPFDNQYPGLNLTWEEFDRGPVNE